MSILAPVLAVAASALLLSPGIGGDPHLFARSMVVDERVTTPPPPPSQQRRLIGEYGEAEGDLMIFQRLGQLFARERGGRDYPLVATGSRNYRMVADGEVVDLKVKSEGFVLRGRYLRRRDFGAEVTRRVRAAVRTDAAELRKAALASAPPLEASTAKNSDLVPLGSVLPGVKLDIRYATTDNFMGIRLYERPVAYLQRPAADALRRVAGSLRARGYGLMVYDAYRPWFVTKMFWDATPPANRAFVADPAKGSRHNRGSAVDLGLFDLRTGAIVDMPSRYDEFSRRAHADFVGGTDRQRWHRDLLRSAMEKEGFAVLPDEWWHFDFKDWRDYPIGNASFSQLEASRTARPR